MAESACTTVATLPALAPPVTRPASCRVTLPAALKSLRSAPKPKAPVTASARSATLVARVPACWLAVATPLRSAPAVKRLCRAPATWVPSARALDWKGVEVAIASVRALAPESMVRSPPLSTVPPLVPITRFWVVAVGSTSNRLKAAGEMKPTLAELKLVALMFSRSLLKVALPGASV